ncbi:transposase family protein [Phocaeicola vulgatus]|nr:transposase family protein [Phocaeicola vulgatus]MDO6197268.1 transposase family protein [Phocaeicola vulgatus]
MVSFKIRYLCLPLFYETRTTPSCHPSGWLIDNFDIVNFDKSADRFDIYLDEKKVQLKEDKTNPDIISYGFGEYRTIQDYPIRGRATYLHVRKRKWLDKSSNEIFSYDWDLSEFDGTRLNSEFVSFLKEGD